MPLGNEEDTEATLTTRTSQRRMKEFIYETMYILRPDIGEERTDGEIDKYRNILLENGAEELDVQHRGKRRLAYDILKHRDGVYVQMNYKAPGASIAIMEKAMKFSDDVLRYLTIKQPVQQPDADDEDGDEEE